MTAPPWLEHLFRPLVLALLAATLVQGVVELLRLLFPDWNSGYLVAFCALTAAEAYYSGRFLDRAHWDVPIRLRYRLGEAVLLFLGLQIAENVLTRHVGPLDDIPRMDGQVGAGAVLVLLVWLAATGSAEDLERIGEPVDPHPSYVPPLESLTGRFFVGGLILLFATGLARIGLAALLQLTRPPVPGLVLNVLVYFLLGAVLLAQMRFSALRESWRVREVQVTPGLTGRWVRYSLVFAGLVAGLAILLPTEYSFGLLDILAVVLNAIYSILWIIFALFLTAILVPLAWLGLRTSPPPIAPRPLLPPPTPPPASDTGGLPIDLLALAQSLLFWVLVLAVAGYLLRTYLHQHPRIMTALARWGPGAILRRWWTTLRGRLAGTRAALATGWRRGLAARRLRRGRGAPGPARVRPGTLAPRDRVRYYYLQLLARAGQDGFPRRPPQTPREYQAALGPTVPAGQQALAGLTTAFQEARYSPHPVSEATAAAAAEDCQAVIAALDAARAAPGAAPPPPGGPR